MGLLKKRKHLLDVERSPTLSPTQQPLVLAPAAAVANGTGPTLDAIPPGSFLDLSAVDDLPIGLKQPSAIGANAQSTPTKPPRVPESQLTPNNTVIHHTPLGVGVVHTLTPTQLAPQVPSPPTPRTLNEPSTPKIQIDPPEMKKLDLGIISLIINAAHNAATMILNLMDEDRPKQDLGLLNLDPERNNLLFTNKLDSLLKPAAFTLLKLLLTEKDTSTVPLNQETVTAPKEPSDSLAPNHSHALDVHFNLIRESPLQTIGLGDLTLEAFDQVQREQQNLSPMPLRKLTLVLRRLRAASPVGVRSPRLGAIDAASTTPAGNGAVANRVLTSNLVRLLERVKLDQSDDNDSIVELEDERVPGATLDTDADVEGVEGQTPRKGRLMRRNKEFHQAFKLIPSLERLLDSFSCALTKDILVQGRMFVLKNYICFNLNILGWVTHLVIPLKEVIQIEKKSTAVLFPNGIVIKTLHQRYVFATFLNREHLFKVIRNAWHQVLNKNGEARTARARAGRKLIDLLALRIEGDSDDDYDLEADIDDDDHDETGSLISDDDMSSLDDTGHNLLSGGGASGGGDGWFGLPIVGPATHAATENGYTKKAGDTFIGDDILNCPLGVAFNCIFGTNTDAQQKFLEKGKNFDISKITALTKDNKERDFQYTKPLNAPIGPKQTRCIIHDKILQYDVNKVICVETITSSPDVPLGNLFKIRLTQYLLWADNNSTRFYTVTAIDWSGKLWIKGAIEKGSIDGQKESQKGIVEFINDLVADSKKGGGSSKKKAKTRSRRNTEAAEKAPEPVKVEVPKEQSLGEKINDVIDLVGKLVPIPMVPSYAVGLIVWGLLFFLGTTVVNSVFGLHRGALLSGATIQVVPGETVMLQIRINDARFVVMPSVDTALNDPLLRKHQEQLLWQWLEERLQHHLKVNPEASEPRKQAERSLREQALVEVIEQTRNRLDDMAANLN